MGHTTRHLQHRRHNRHVRPQTLRSKDQKQHPHHRHHRQHHIRPYVTRAMLTNHHLVIRGTNTTGDDDSDNS